MLGSGAAVAAGLEYVCYLLAHSSRVNGLARWVTPRFVLGTACWLFLCLFLGCIFGYDIEQGAAGWHFEGNGYARSSCTLTQRMVLSFTGEGQDDPATA